MSWHKEQLGFLTIASNTQDINYLQLAYVQALNIKITQKNNSFAVIVDDNTAKCIEEKHKKVFDYIIETTKTSDNPYELEPKVFELTPFKETIKLESDILFTRSIDHWWSAFRLRDLVLSTGCKNYLGVEAESRKYRKVFDDNNLPDIYTGLMYFRFTKTAKDFFTKAHEIFNSWDKVCNSLLNCRDNYATTDVAYALTASIVGTEKCTIPTADFINFVHMKAAINKFDEGCKFTDFFVTEICDNMIRINNINQYYPLHYYDKTFITKDIVEYYERKFLERSI